MATGRVLRVLSGHADWVDSVAIVPSTGAVLTASVDGRTVAWDPCTWCSSAELLSERLDAATVRCLTADESRTLLGDLEATTDEACAA